LVNYYEQVSDLSKSISFTFKTSSQKVICYSKRINDIIESVWVLQQDNPSESLNLVIAVAHDLRRPIDSILSLTNFLKVMIQADDIDKPELNKMIN
jgi:hypothetical protein